jgi:hypothetical protein
MSAIAWMKLVLASCGGESNKKDAQPSASSAATSTKAVLPEIEGPPPTAGALVGTWSQIGVAVLVRFSRDATFAFDRPNLATPYAKGTYEVDGRTITFTSNGPDCVDTWVWEGGITEEEDPLDDELNIVFVEGGCKSPTGEEWKLARLALE